MAKIATGAPAPSQKLHKMLALSGLGSRRDMETLIASGEVRVNGKIAPIGARVHPNDVVKIGARIIRLRFDHNRPRVLVYHKPEGEIVSRDDPGNRPTVFAKLPRIQGAKWIAVGRLDLNSSGLMIFTTSGELANSLMHPRFEVEREYAARVVGRMSEEQLKAATAGVELDDGQARFDSVTDEGGEGTNHWYRVVLREGRKREVRRLFEALGLLVSRLIRVRYGIVTMPPHLKRGQMLELEPGAVERITAWSGIQSASQPPRRNEAASTRPHRPRNRSQSSSSRRSRKT